ncbi:MAG: DNA-3-methyladenine glycosylase [Patescibacteria group bacterium]
MEKVLKEDFFKRDTKIVAKEMIGKFLVRKIKGKRISVMITETEAYDGHHDKASHAYKGRTKRTRVMFGNPGNFYVYLCYGMYYMLNVVAREHGYPAAVLIRGVKSDGLNLSGPGKLTKFLKINRRFNNKKSAVSTGLWFEDRGVKISKNKIKKTSRVGVNYAGPVWSAKKLRFVFRVQ